jgi:hypothetical protein
MYVKESIYSVVVVNFTIGILKFLLTTTTECIEPWTYVIKSCSSLISLSRKHNRRLPDEDVCVHASINVGSVGYL